MRSFQCIMVLFVVNGALGLYQHYQGNLEFELEMYPSISGFELVWEALKGPTPSLAPGTMVLLGMLGLIYTFRHPTVTDTHLGQTSGGLGHERTINSAKRDARPSARGGMC